MVTLNLAHSFIQQQQTTPQKPGLRPGLAEMRCDSKVARPFQQPVGMSDSEAGYSSSDFENDDVDQSAMESTRSSARRGGKSSHSSASTRTKPSSSSSQPATVTQHEQKHSKSSNESGDSDSESGYDDDFEEPLPSPVSPSSARPVPQTMPTETVHPPANPAPTHSARSNAESKESSVTSEHASMASSQAAPQSPPAEPASASASQHGLASDRDAHRASQVSAKPPGKLRNNTFFPGMSSGGMPILTISSVLSSGSTRELQQESSTDLPHGASSSTTSTLQHPSMQEQSYQSQIFQRTADTYARTADASGGRSVHRRPRPIAGSGTKRANARGTLPTDVDVPIFAGDIRPPLQLNGPSQTFTSSVMSGGSVNTPGLAWGTWSQYSSSSGPPNMKKIGAPSLPPPLYGAGTSVGKSKRRVLASSKRRKASMKQGGRSASQRSLSTASHGSSAMAERNHSGLARAQSADTLPSEQQSAPPTDPRATAYGTYAYLAPHMGAHDYKRMTESLVETGEAAQRDNGVEGGSVDPLILAAQRHSRSHPAALARVEVLHRYGPGQYSIRHQQPSGFMRSLMQGQAAKANSSTPKQPQAGSSNNAVSASKSPSAGRERVEALMGHHFGPNRRASYASTLHSNSQLDPIPSVGDSQTESHQSSSALDSQLGLNAGSSDAQGDKLGDLKPSGLGVNTVGSAPGEESGLLDVGGSTDKWLFGRKTIDEWQVELDREMESLDELTLLFAKPVMIEGGWYMLKATATIDNLDDVFGDLNSSVVGDKFDGTDDTQWKFHGGAAALRYMKFKQALRSANTDISQLQGSGLVLHLFRQDQLGSAMTGSGKLTPRHMAYLKKQKSEVLEAPTPSRARKWVSRPASGKLYTDDELLNVHFTSDELMFFSGTKGEWMRPWQVLKKNQAVKRHWSSICTPLLKRITARPDGSLRFSRIIFRGGAVLPVQEDINDPHRATNQPKQRMATYGSASPAMPRRRNLPSTAGSQLSSRSDAPASHRSGATDPSQPSAGSSGRRVFITIRAMSRRTFIDQYASALPPYTLRSGTELRRRRSLVWVNGSGLATAATRVIDSLRASTKANDVQAAVNAIRSAEPRGRRSSVTFLAAGNAPGSDTHTEMLRDAAQESTSEREHLPGDPAEERPPTMNDLVFLVSAVETSLRGLPGRTYNVAAAEHDLASVVGTSLRHRVQSEGLPAVAKRIVNALALEVKSFTDLSGAGDNPSNPHGVPSPSPAAPILRFEPRSNSLRTLDDNSSSDEEEAGHRETKELHLVFRPTAR